MEPAKVPQHLELGDVVAWGLDSSALLCILAGALISWRLYLLLAVDPFGRAILVSPVFGLGAALALVRILDRNLRDWIVLALAYALRPHVLLTGAQR